MEMSKTSMNERRGNNWYELSILEIGEKSSKKATVPSDVCH